MNDSKLQIELEVLKNLKEELEAKIKDIENILKPSTLPDAADKPIAETEEIDFDCDSKELYEKYLSEVNKINEKTIKKYLRYLDKLEEFLGEYAYFCLSEPIYYITDKAILRQIKKIMASNRDIIDINKKHHNTYTASFNNYYRFITERYDPSEGEEEIDSEFVLDE